MGQFDARFDSERSELSGPQDIASSRAPTPAVVQGLTGDAFSSFSTLAASFEPIPARGSINGWLTSLKSAQLHWV
jgi:hypothetical protein